MRERTAVVLERELKPMPGVAEVLTKLPGARCVASNGHLQRVRERLALTGLLRFFDPHVYSAIQVAAGKPAPDLFLLAAERLGAARRPALSSRTASSASPPRSPPACRWSGFAAAAIAPRTMPRS